MPFLILRYLLYILIWISINSFPLLSNQFAYETFHSIIEKHENDIGENWSTISCFGLPNYFYTSHNKINRNPLEFDFMSVFSKLNNEYEISSFSYVNYGNKMFFFLAPSIKTHFKNDHYQVLDHVPQQKKSISFKNRLSGFGFRSEWYTLKIGQGIERWGAGNNIELAMSEDSNPFDYFLLASDYGNLRVRYIHGFLETIDEGINRYINARGIEWTNKKSIIVGLSETIIYSGENRSIDLAYINPIASHLEIEMNNRLNILDQNSSNAVWQIHFDGFLFKRFRISFNYLVDELVIDPDMQKNKESGLAYSGNFVYTPYNGFDHVFSIYSSVVKIGTPTFRHSSGYNNFVNKSRPLGYIQGSDLIEYKIGVKYNNRKNIVGNLQIGFLNKGEESIYSIGGMYDTYPDYFRGKFPSGQLQKFKYLNFQLYYLINESSTISLETCIEDRSNHDKEKSIENHFKISFYFYFLKNKDYHSNIILK